MKIIPELEKVIQIVLNKMEIGGGVNVSFEHPADSQHGDWSTNIALTLFKQQNKFSSPRALADSMSEEIKKSLPNFVSKVEVAGPGFINFYLSEHYLMSEMVVLLENRAQLKDQQNTGKKAIVEFSSPNIAKPFTIGHLRSSIIGWSLANLLEETGYEVFRDNHLGDWGTQFGKQIYALKHLGGGSLEKNIEKLSKSDNPVKDLVALYVEFHKVAEEKPEMEDEARAIFKKLEDGDDEMRQLWQKCIDWSFVEFNRIYDLLNISFTENNGRGYGESYFEDKMDVVVSELESKAKNTKGISYVTGNNGAKLVNFSEESKLPPLMILKSDGATLYATRDLATDKWRLSKYGSDILIINEVGAEQSLYFQQIYALEKALGWVKDGQRVHVGHGMYRFKEGKMSTRKGNVIWLEDVLNEAKSKAAGLASDKKVLSEEEIEKVAFGALKWSDLKRSARLDVAFDWDEIMTMQGNSGPYLQYTYVRCQSILNKAQNLDTTKYSDLLVNLKSYSRNTQRENLTPAEIDLLRNLSTYFEVVEKSAREYAPHHLATYLFGLAQTFNQFYGNTQVIGGAEEVEKFRLALVATTSLVLKRGLHLLGIEVVEKM
ncbi:arginine--tRNA ligase [Patescibacteria group bacterium]|nr:arginine--tRNA ligase [Patescibacteria group bacterium]